MDFENIGSLLQREDAQYALPFKNTDITTSIHARVPLHSVYANQPTVPSSPILIAPSYSACNSHIMKQQHMMPSFSNPITPITNHMTLPKNPVKQTLPTIPALQSHSQPQPQRRLPPTNTNNKPSKKEPEIIRIIEVPVLDGLVIKRVDDKFDFAKGTALQYDIFDISDLNQIFKDITKRWAYFEHFAKEDIEDMMKPLLLPKPHEDDPKGLRIRFKKRLHKLQRAIANALHTDDAVQSTLPAVSPSYTKKQKLHSPKAMNATIPRKKQKLSHSGGVHDTFQPNRPDRFYIMNLFQSPTYNLVDSRLQSKPSIPVVRPKYVQYSGFLSFSVKLK